MSSKASCSYTFFSLYCFLLSNNNIMIHFRTIYLTLGLGPILQEDITIQICTSICSAISGIIVLVTTYLLLHQRKNSANSADITELHVVETMFLSYLYSYTILYTAFEPIRAAIQATYIAFAQNPHCFLHTYPLIYHRLYRLSTTTATTN